jgi:ABC-type sugar transport system substrate-binding protein
MTSKISVIAMLFLCLALPTFGERSPSFDSQMLPADSGTVKPVAKAKKHIRIAVIGLENNPFWIPVKGGALAASKELQEFNGQADWILPAEDDHLTSSQKAENPFAVAIAKAVKEGYDGIATVAGNESVIPAIDKAVAAGVPVATFNSETNKPNKRLFYVGANSYLQGQVAGKEMAAAVGNKGDIAIITGFFSVEAHEQRKKGLIDFLKKNAPGITIVGEFENKDKYEEAYEITKVLLQKYPDLKGIYVTAGGPFGAAAAVEKEGRKGKVKIICYDFVKETMAYVKNGVITGTIGQQPYAQGHDPAIRLFNYIVSGVVPFAGQLNTRMDFVTKDNIAEFWKE